MSASGSNTWLAIVASAACSQNAATARATAEMKKHVASTHKIKAASYKESPLWKECQLQTYFTGKGQVDYFIVVEKKGTSKRARDSGRVTEAEKVLFERLEEDYKGVRDDVEEQASTVHDFGDSRSARVPWLGRTAFPFHLAKLKDEEVRSSYELPPTKCGCQGCRSCPNPSCS
jgi:hypothetical protein